MAGNVGAAWDGFYIVGKHAQCSQERDGWQREVQVAGNYLIISILKDDYP